MEGNQQEVNWKPLESNPDVMNPFAQNLGFDISRYSYQDVLSLEEWAQEMIPKPVKSLMLLFPIKEKTSEFVKQEQERIEKEGQIVSDKLFFMKQYARNACGTVALIHSIINLLREDPSLMTPGSTVEKFLQDTQNLNPHEAGLYFLHNEELKNQHSNAFQGGQSNQAEEVETHFIDFYLKDGHIYELDGTKKFPINHGPSNEENFLADCCKIAQQFMDRDPEETNFTIMALAQTPSE